MIFNQTNGGGGGGASNVVFGSFTTRTSGSGFQTVDVPYYGVGYPVSLILSIEGGADAVSDVVHRYASLNFYISKRDELSAPSYTGDGTLDRAVYAHIYKSSATATTINYQANTTMIAYDTALPTAAAATNEVRIISNTAFSVRTQGASDYGLLPEHKYNYTMVYSE